MTDDEWVTRYVLPVCRHTTYITIPSGARWAIGSEREKDGTLVLIAPRENPTGEPQNIVELFGEKNEFDEIKSPWQIDKGGGRIVVHISFYLPNEHVPATVSTPKSGRSGKRKRPPTPSINSEDDEAEVEEIGGFDDVELEDDVGQSEDPTTPSQRPLILSGVDPDDVDPVPDLHPLTTVQVKSERTRSSDTDSSLEDVRQCGSEDVSCTSTMK